MLFVGRLRRNTYYYGITVTLLHSTRSNFQVLTSFSPVRSIISLVAVDTTKVQLVVLSSERRRGVQQEGVIGNNR